MSTQAFGDVQGLHTASKQLGIVVVAYYDLRAAVSAQNTLQGTLINKITIDVQFAPPARSAAGWPIHQVRSSSHQCLLHSFDFLGYVVMRASVSLPAACNILQWGDGTLAACTLQGQVTVYNLDPDTSNEQLVWLFSKFGDVQVSRAQPSLPCSTPCSRTATHFSGKQAGRHRMQGWAGNSSGR